MSNTSVAAYLSGSIAGTYYVGLYVQSTGVNCSGNTIYCSTNADTSTNKLCMIATYDGSGTVTALSQPDNGNAVLNQPASTFYTGMNANLVLGQLDFTTSTAATTQNGFNHSTRVATDASGNLWITDGSNNRMLEFGPIPE